MSLADYVPVRETVEFKGGSVSVRGLALDDIGVLMKNHISDLDGLAAIYGKNVNQEIQVAALAQYIIALVKEAPGLVANLIAIASDEPNQVERARTLRMTSQVVILQTIAQLTFEESGGPKKLFESLLPLLMNKSPVL